MVDKTKKNEGPACACGRTDLYEEWLKNEERKKENPESETSSNEDESNGTPESSDKKH